jgi:hypothetical protein
MYYLDVSYTLAEIIGPFAASALMRISLWIPCVIGLALLALSLITVILMPEPWQSRSPCGVQGIAHLAAPGSEPLGTTRQHSETMNTSATQKNIILTMPQFFVVPLKYILLGILVQYSSARFRWELGETGVFRSETAIVELVQYIFLLPVLLRYLRSKSSSSRAQVNLKIVNYSIACLCIGSVCIALCSMRWLLIPGLSFPFN